MIKNIKIRYVYELIRITRFLYPTQKVQHTFDGDLNRLGDRFNATDLVLINDLTKSLAMINHQDRDQKNGMLLASRSDFYNALYLISPYEFKLSDAHYNFLAELHEKFGLELFTHLIVSLKLPHSISGVKRLLKPLVYHGFVILDHVAKQKRQYFKINTSRMEEFEQNPAQSSYEQAMQEWDDFKGWIDTQNRT
ncbi:MAG: hypothetical protein GQ574_29160 [Crocinitomix sp.]|nr:hypothetical protein [Crocinitomix sp.]